MHVKVASKRSTLHPTTAVFPQGTSLALAISSVLICGTAQAQDNNSSESIELDTLSVEEEVTPDTNPYAVPGAPYLSDSSADQRRTRPISETPQTITVLTATEIEDSGRSDLKHILDGQPGITLGTGENGNAFGDRYIIRGHEARSDMFVDGLRDPGMTVRESFAVEQIEITKGPSSTFAGRGSTGGAVNSVTKRASTEYDFNKLSLGLGTDSHYRAAVDVNHVINYDTAVRANVVMAAEDVPDRGPADRERKGLALSLTHQATDKLNVTADYYHFEGDDKPDLGTYIKSLGDGKYGDPVKDIPVYLQDNDFIESSVDTATLRLSYDANPNLRIVNLMRYGVTDNGYVATGARGSTVYANQADAEAGVNGYESPTLSKHQGYQEVEYFGNQLSIIFNKELGGLNNEFVFGLGYTDQSVLNGVYSITNNGVTNCVAAGRRGIADGYCITDVNGNAIGNLSDLMGSEITKGDKDSDWHVKTTSISAMDTVDFSDRLTAFAGVRYDHYDYSNVANFDPDGRDGPLERAPFKFTDTDGLINGHLGITYELKPGLNIYGSYATSSNINGGESDVGTSCGYGGICVDSSDPTMGDPERAVNLELGAKWLVGEKLLASASVFQTKKTDVMEDPSGDSYSALGSLNTGENVVKGVEFGVAGNLSPKLSVQAGFTIMDAEVTKSVTADNEGKTLGNFADTSASVHLRYQASSKIAFGGTATYEGARYTGQPDSAANEEMEVPKYTVFDMFGSYAFNRDLNLRLNVGNVLDEDYYLAAYRSGSFTYIGDRRNARLTLSYSF